MKIVNDLEAMFWYAKAGRTSIIWPPGGVGSKVELDDRKRIIRAFNVIGRNVKKYNKIKGVDNENS